MKFIGGLVVLFVFLAWFSGRNGPDDVNMFVAFGSLGVAGMVVVGLVIWVVVALLRAIFR